MIVLLPGAGNNTITVAPNATMPSISNVISVNEHCCCFRPNNWIRRKMLLVTASTIGTAGATDGTITVALPYMSANLNTAGSVFTTTGIKVFVYGSEYEKGKSLNGNTAACCQSN